MSLPALKPDWKLGDPGSSVSSSGQPSSTITYKPDGTIFSQSYGAATQFDGRSQRGANLNSQRKSLSPGNVWRCSTDYFRYVSRVDWSPGTASKPIGENKQVITRPGSDYSAFGIDGFPPRCAHSGVTFDDNLMNRAVTECLLKLNTGKTHLLTDIAEARKSVNTMADRYSRTVRLLLNIRRRNVRIGRPDDLFDTYLEWEYGWKPIANTLFNSVQTAKKAFNKPLLIEGYREVRQNSGFVRNSGGYHVQSSANLQEMATCHIFAKLSDKYAAAMQGLGLNPLTAAWELVPWSFLVDWVLPIGNTLEALTATSGLLFWDGYKSRVVEARSSGERILTGYTGDYPGYDCQVYEFRRTKLGSFPRPVPYFKSPFSTSHVVNAIALTGSLHAARRYR